MTRSLYVHVPFCARKCDYCAFYSHAPQTELVDRYVRSLIAELRGVEGRPETVFFGGGTPSILTERQWLAIFKAMEEFGLLGASEWTVECNPATVSGSKARLWREYGVNRVSMGVQSLSPGLLEVLGRIHTREAVFQSFGALRDAGFDNINLDLMFAIPGQTLEVWSETLTEAIAMGSEHLACYEVIYEEDTPLFDRLSRGEIAEDEDLACEMYERLCAEAARAGYAQYEIANFARRGTGDTGDAPALACRHNLNYWDGGENWACGPSAAGLIDGARTKNWSNTGMYCDFIEAGRGAVETREVLGPVERAGEIAAFGLRRVSGWRFEAFVRRTGLDLRRGWAAEMEELVRRGHGVQDGDGFRLTPEGLRFADAAAELFLRTPAEAAAERAWGGSGSAEH